ncbi:putative sulfate exporter family transporter [Oceanospirillum beijerinckii]|uniref:putative sulfate exporter family transporter n=1 Tax=Oceanospirillum beijerinckii TaxID=64976 RepID=UPI0003F84880|nr:putative sulfate exporter family transporter [Oceanospirillum beijerinckii]
MANSAKGLTFFPDSSRSYLTELLPGFMLCLVVGRAATFVSDHYGGPTILYALLMGMSLNYLSQEGRCVTGIQFSAKAVQRIGIALLGARITFEQLLGLGITPIAIVLAGVPAPILESMTELSRWCLIVAMVGLGMKASFKELSTMGWKPVVLLVSETLFLALLVMIWLFIAR